MLLGLILLQPWILNVMMNFIVCMMVCSFFIRFIYLSFMWWIYLIFITSMIADCATFFIFFFIKDIYFSSMLWVYSVICVTIVDILDIVENCGQVRLMRLQSQRRRNVDVRIVIVDLFSNTLIFMLMLLNLCEIW